MLLHLRTASFRSPLEPGVESVAETVADHIERKDCQHDRKPRKGDGVVGDSDIRPGSREHAPPLRHRRLGAQAEKPEPAAARIEPAVARVTCTITGLSELGRMCRNMVRNWVAREARWRRRRNPTPHL